MSYTEINVAKEMLPTLAPFWMITRWFMHPENVTDDEREEASAAGLTDFDDFNSGLCYNRQADAETIAAAMAKRFDQPFGVTDDGGLVSVFMPDGTFYMFRLDI